ncbi:heterokaryon incompatibility protein-domain-containing protein [Lasiosphaeria ovina]|uniref:Heterokaryon incompatibility protein-domain-containing protein n=1 Tax=Lasiosphaeria ovina TaxID=92902 RepID=A0AAE0JX05_9PEZI|nr:heterokaryon incompatibility protein-domain-containing protein [Lasiosphaeria ovina]
MSASADSDPALAILGNDETLNPSLCAACRGLFTKQGIHQLRTQQGYRHLKLADIRSSSQKGCPVCKLFLEPENWGAALYGNGMDDRYIFARIENDSSYVRPSGAFVMSRLELSWVTDEKRQFRKRISPLSFYAHQDDPCAAFVPRRPVHSDFASPKIISTARAFIDECRAGHAECEPRESPACLPTRVLDVTGNRPEAEVKLHLPHPQEIAEYVTLSYCWGGPQPLLLTLETLEEFQSGIDISRLPPTIRDAVVTTRNLGFQYLWVDALCIIQDSEQDKFNEIGNMGEVYRNSTITLSASQATSVTQGFSPVFTFQGVGADGDNIAAQGVAVDLSLAAGKRGRFHLTKKVYDQVETQPLNKRGWALQEYLLSGRILSFGNEAVWICGRHKHRPLIPSVMYVAVFPSLARTTLSAARQLNADQRSELWADAVNDFTGRDLTIADDRIRALTGVISVFEVAWADKCLWGLWESNFVVDAWWRRSRAAPPALSNARSRRAPSWSWMSVDSQVQQRDQSARSTTASLVSIADSRWAVNLAAKLIPARQQQQRLVMHMDLTEEGAREEVNGRAMSLLQLGEHLNGFSEGLLVVEEAVGSNTFRRVGFFESCDDSHLWADAQYRTVELV